MQEMRDRMENRMNTSQTKRSCYFDLEDRFFTWDRTLEAHQMADNKGFILLNEYKSSDSILHLKCKHCKQERFPRFYTLKSVLKPCTCINKKIEINTKEKLYF